MLGDFTISKMELVRVGIIGENLDSSQIALLYMWTVEIHLWGVYIMFVSCNNTTSGKL